MMQTIEEYRQYTKQLEGEVGKWHDAYEAVMVERTQLAKKVRELEDQLEKATAIIEGVPRQEHDTEIDTLASGNRNLSEVINAMSAELEELRKHELEWELDKARIKELETELKQTKGEK